MDRSGTVMDDAELSITVHYRPLPSITVHVHYCPRLLCVRPLQQPLTLTPILPDMFGRSAMPFRFAHTMIMTMFVSFSLI